VKLANHGRGRAMHPESAERTVTPTEEQALREFLGTSIPSLKETTIEYTRVCVYCDTWDEHFWIAPDPDCKGLIVATGGSGHAFKFAPLLGTWIADAVEGNVRPRFRWRTDDGTRAGEEQARHRGTE